MPKLTTFKGKSRWPMPVYIARLRNGETARISFWSPSDKPIDIARGRYVAEQQCGERAWPSEEVTACVKHGLRKDGPHRGAHGCYCRAETGDMFTTETRPLLNMKEALPPLVPADIVSGEVEYAGDLYADPMDGAAVVWPTGEAPKRKAPGASHWKTLAEALIKHVEAGDLASARQLAHTASAA